MCEGFDAGNWSAPDIRESRKYGDLHMKSEVDNHYRIVGDLLASSNTFTSEQEENITPPTIQPTTRVPTPQTSTDS